MFNAMVPDRNEATTPRAGRQRQEQEVYEQGNEDQEVLPLTRSSLSPNTPRSRAEASSSATAPTTPASAKRHFKGSSKTRDKSTSHTPSRDRPIGASRDTNSQWSSSPAPHRRLGSRKVGGAAGGVDPSTRGAAALRVGRSEGVAGDASQGTGKAQSRTGGGAGRGMSVMERARRLAARVSRVSSASVSSSLSSASEDASSDRDTFGVGIGRHALKGARPLTSSRKASSAMIRAGGGRRDCGGDEACVKLGEGAEDLAHDGGVGGRRRVDEPGRDQQEWNVRSQKILARWTSGVRKL
jgi:hypothetical protein